MEEINLKCILFDECTVNTYGYYMYLNGEKIRAGYCFTNIFGNSFCDLNGVEYKNVTYHKEIVDSHIDKGFNLIGLFLPLIIIIMSTSIFIYIIKNHIRSKKEK